MALPASKDLALSTGIQMTIASSMLLQFWQTLGLVGIIIAVGLALYVLITILVNDRKDKQRAAGQ